MKDDVVERLKRVIPDEKFEVKEATGAWDGQSEPSFIIEFDRLNDDTLSALAKIADEFDQDEVHIRSNDIDYEAEPLVLQKDGSFNTPFVLMKFNGDVPFEDITSGKYGIKYGTVLEDNVLLLYQSELPSESGKTVDQSQKDFYESVNKIKDEYKNSIGGTEEGYTKLRRYSRNGREGVSTSYEQAISNLRPSDKTKRRLEGNHEKT